MKVITLIFALMWIISPSHSLQILQKGIDRALTTHPLRQTYQATPITRKPTNSDSDTRQYLLEEIISFRLDTFKQKHIPLLSAKRPVYSCYLNDIYDTINAYMIGKQIMTIETNDFTNYRKAAAKTYLAFHAKQQREEGMLENLSVDEKIALKDTQLLIDFFGQYYDHLNYLPSE